MDDCQYVGKRGIYQVWFGQGCDGQVRAEACGPLGGEAAAEAPRPVARVVEASAAEAFRALVEQLECLGA